MQADQHLRCAICLCTVVLMSCYLPQNMLVLDHPDSGVLIYGMQVTMATMVYPSVGPQPGRTQTVVSFQGVHL